MTKKRTNSVTENTEDVSMKFKKPKEDLQLIKNDVEQISTPTSDNSVNKSNEENLKHGLHISITKDILYKGDEKFLELFKDSQNIVLGRHFLVTYGSKKEAQEKLKALSKLNYQGLPLKVDYKKPSINAKATKQKSLSVKQENLARIVLFKVPMSANLDTLKKNFSDAVKILKRKKKGKGEHKSFDLLYKEKSQAEQDLIKSKTLLIDGEHIESFLVDNNTSGSLKMKAKGKSNSVNGKAENKKDKRKSARKSAE